MKKRSPWDTAAIIAAIFMMAWVIRSDMAENTENLRRDIAANNAAIAANATAIAANTAAIAELRGAVAANTAAMAELRGALLSHIGGHNHAPVIAKSDENK